MFDVSNKEIGSLTLDGFLGRLDLEEFAKLLEETGQITKFARDGTPLTGRAIFQKLDPDNTGHVNIETLVGTFDFPDGEEKLAEALEALEASRAGAQGTMRACL
jgi:hypothetical protein